MDHQGSGGGGSGTNNIPKLKGILIKTVVVSENNDFKLNGKALEKTKAFTTERFLKYFHLSLPVKPEL
eukprot:gene42181-52298_t